MYLFVLLKVWEIEILDKTSTVGLFAQIKAKSQLTEIFGIQGILCEIEEDWFVTLAPLFNWLCGINFFYNSYKISFEEKYLNGKNIFDLNYDKKKIESITWDIQKVKKFMNSNKLLTNSKKEEFKDKLIMAVYNLCAFQIKTYFLIYESFQNKEQLNNIINSSNTLQEFKSQAELVKSLSHKNLELLLPRFEFVGSQILLYTNVIYKYLENNKLDKW